MNESRLTIGIIALCALAWGGIVLRNSSDNLSKEIYERTVSDAQVEDAARVQLTQLQRQSFNADTEFCGLLAENSDAEIVSRTVRVGDHESCDVSYFDVRTLYPLAIYHTHAGFNPDYDSEVPSDIDLEGSLASGMDGYIATPGGRFWHVDASAGVARQVCGEGCLPQDPSYRACNAPEPAPSYTLATLNQRFRQQWASC